MGSQAYTPPPSTVQKLRAETQGLSSQIERLSNRITKVGMGDYPVWVLDNRLSEITSQRLQILEQLEAIDLALA